MKTRTEYSIDKINWTYDDFTTSDGLSAFDETNFLYKRVRNLETNEIIGEIEKINV